MILVLLLLILLCGYTMTMSLYKPSLRRKKTSRETSNRQSKLYNKPLSLSLHNLSNKRPSNKIFIHIDNEKQKSKKTKQKKNAARNVESAIETLRQQLSLHNLSNKRPPNNTFIYIDNEKQKQ
jgi:hypothetical protein